MLEKKVNSKKIDIFYLGLPKCGSTWLYEVFTKHNNVVTACPRDLHFFDLYFDRGEKWFHKFFNIKTHKNSPVCIDICHDYILNNNSIRNILNYNSEAKIIYHFRDPTNLINSLYKETSIAGFIYFKELGYYKPTSKEEFIKHPLVKNIINFNLHIDQILNNFKKENIVICSSEFINKNKKRYLEILDLKFKIGIEENKMVDYFIRPNSKRYIGLKFTIKFLSYISFRIRRNGNYFLMKMISLKSIFNSFKNINQEKINNHKVDNFKIFDNNLINDLFISVNGCEYSELIRKLEKKIKIYN